MPERDTKRQPTTHTAVVSAALLDDAPQNESSLSAPKINTVVSDYSDNILHKRCTDMETEPEP